MRKFIVSLCFSLISLTLSAETFDQFKEIFNNANRAATDADFQNINKCYAVEAESPIRVDQYKYSYKLEKLNLGPVLGTPEYPTIRFSRPLSTIEFRINEYFFDKETTATSLIYTSKSKKRIQLAAFKHGYEDIEVLIFELKQSILLDKPKNDDPIYYNRIIYGQCDYKE